MSSTPHRRGVVLIVVLGVLTVLALLATAFATLSGVERTVSRNYLDTVRARLLAMSGIEDAIDKVSSLAERGEFNDPSLQYWGSDVHEAGVPDWKTPLEEAANPSFAWENEPRQNPYDVNMKPLLFDINGKQIGISGVMNSGTYCPSGDVYRLRVTDCNSMLNVNDGVENGTSGNVSQNLRRILNNLGDILAVPTAGDRILHARPSRGYVSRREVEAVLGKTDYSKMRPYITTVSWVDANVCNPVPLGAETLSAYPVKFNDKLGVYRYGRNFGTDGSPVGLPLRFAPDFADPAGVNHAIMGLDEVNAQWIEITRRSPVNINMAPREVLTALIQGLRGVFWVERRKHNPDGQRYSFLQHLTYDNTPSGRRGDEFGYLYATVPFLGMRETSAEGGVSAERVAMEIVACRNRQASPNCPGVDYRSVWYGGPFKTWRQFNAFCDGLVKGDLLRDERPIYYEYDPVAAAGSASGSDNIIRSRNYEQMASQALADVLKANFNPNTMLNELNPDANHFTLVDKTDLLLCSTEFCFTPMGIFEIESEGVVVSTAGNVSLFAAQKGRAVARKKVACTVKVYDVSRETMQQELTFGESAPGGGGAGTDQNRTMIVGPEPQVGSLAQECRWAGFIQLSTIGGHAGHNGPELGDVIHSHFSEGHAAHFHAGGGSQPIRDTGGTFRNNPDRTEGGTPGPYDPALGGGRWRQARDWEQRKLPENAANAAASDLRWDGAYIERDSSVMYQNSDAVFDLVGTVAYWIKPAFYPERTGKPRTFFSTDIMVLSESPTRTIQGINGQWFLASHDQRWGDASTHEDQQFTASAYWRPCVMMGGYSTHYSYAGGQGTQSLSLNHRSHADHTRVDILRGHFWIHVGYHWDMARHRTVLLINGRVVPSGFNELVRHPQSRNTVADFTPAPIRLGEPSRTMVESPTRGRNWAADATMDEFYMWKGDKVAESQMLWSRGRYYVPRGGRAATFTSRHVPLDETRPRGLPAPSAARPPSGAAAPPPQAAGPARPGLTTTDPRPTAWVLGGTFTLYPEFTDERGVPRIMDYQAMTDTFKGEELDMAVELRFLVSGEEQLHGVKDDQSYGLSGPLAIAGKEKLQYRISVRLPRAQLDTVLLTTPVIEDVTIYYTTGRQFLLYEVNDAVL